MNIPILNIYHMLIYAWDVLDEADCLDLQVQDCTKLVDLFARVLHSGTESILRRGLDRGYLTRSDHISGVKGKLDLGATLKRNTVACAQVVCEYDDLSYDVLHNRILATTMRRLLTVRDLNPSISDQLYGTCYRMHQVHDIELSGRMFRAVQLYRNNRQYRLLMDVCHLIFRSGLVTESAGEAEFRDFIRDERRMRIMFERFVRNFYRKHATGFRVTGNRLKWAELQGQSKSLELLPEMRTDTRLRSKEKLIIIETKFVPRVLQRTLVRETLRSAHLYQLFAYVSNISKQTVLPVEGILLYPVVDTAYDVRFKIGGNAYRVYALDLNRPWQCIESDLLSLPAAATEQS